MSRRGLRGRLAAASIMSGSLWATGATASTGARRKPPSIVSSSSRFPWAGSTCTSFMKRVRARTRCRCYCRTAGRVRSSSSIRSCPCSRTPRVLAGIPGIPSPSWRRRCQGYTLSFAPGQKRFGVEEISELLADLMTDVLGYGQFAAQGGDWGAFITSRLGYQFPERIIGIHLNMLAVRRDPKMLENPTAEEKTFLGELNVSGTRGPRRSMRLLAAVEAYRHPKLAQGLDGCGNVAPGTRSAALPGASRAGLRHRRNGIGSARADGVRSCPGR